MKGHEQIIEARMKGMKPETIVFVEVGQSLKQHAEMVEHARRSSACEYGEGRPGCPMVFLEPHESARTADWSWAIGLRVNVSGDDQARVDAACDRIEAAGASLVLGYAGNELRLTDRRSE